MLNKRASTWGIIYKRALYLKAPATADGASWRDMVRDVIAHRYRAAVQTEAYLDLQCVIAKETFGA